MNILVYDCEIEKAILKKNEPKIEGILYCRGWRDFKGMGISCIGAYDYMDSQYHIYCEDNFKDFQKLVDKHDIIVGFNNWAFDDKLCEANNIVIPKEKSYDILVEVWAGVGLSSEYEYPASSGYSLGQICEANFNIGKTGDGGNAPVLWQQGCNGAVLNYCLSDCFLTKKLLDQIINFGKIINPKSLDKEIIVKKPNTVEKCRTQGLKRN